MTDHETKQETTKIIFLHKLPYRKNEHEMNMKVPGIVCKHCSNMQWGPKFVKMETQI